MKMLMITQKVDLDDDILGFAHGWVLAMAQKVEKLYVVALFAGRHALPDNVQLLSLGKEKGYAKIREVFNFYKYIIKYRKDYDIVFVHITSLWIVLGGLLFRAWRKKVVLWFCHRKVTLTLRIAEKLTDKIITATEQSIGLTSSKILFVGQGIDTDYFTPLLKKEATAQKIILAVGRMSPVKKRELKIQAIDILYNERGLRNFKVIMVGAPSIKSDIIYFERLKQLVSDKKLGQVIEFVGFTPYSRILPFYQKADLLVSTSATEGLDKVVLEAMACGVLVIAASGNYTHLFGPYEKMFFAQEGTALAIADKIQQVLGLDNQEVQKISVFLRQQVIQNHNLQNLAQKIINVFTNIS